MTNLLGKLFAKVALKINSFAETKDILILEDYPWNQEKIIKQIPAGLTYFIARDGQEFERFFDEYNKARVYLLDNQVPDSTGEVGSHFEKHYKYLLKHDPKAVVFCHGLAYWDKSITDYCERRRIGTLNIDYPPWIRLVIKNGLKEFLKRNSKDVSPEDLERISRDIEEIKE